MFTGSWGTVTSTLSLALVCGCAGKAETGPARANGSAPSALFGSGTRLKAHYLDAGGGARRLVGFHDRELDLECTFQETTLGDFSCLPRLGTTTFSDDSRRMPVAYECRNCTGQEPYTAGMLVTAKSPNCDLLNAPYSLVERQVGVDHFATIDGCLPPSASASPSERWTTRPEPLSRFVHGSVSLVGAATGIRARRITGDDGSFMNLELVNGNEPCFPLETRDGWRCIPGPLAFQTSRSSSPSCTSTDSLSSVAATRERCSGAKPRYVSITSSDDVCRREQEIHELEGPVEEVFTFAWDGTGNPPVRQTLAETNPQEARRSFYRTGAIASASAFAALSHAYVGEGELGLIAFTDDSGAPLSDRASPWYLLGWERRDGMGCWANTDPNGVIRCYHRMIFANLGSGFSDPDCTEPVFADYGVCGAPTALYLLLPTESSSLAYPQIAEIREAVPYTGLVYRSQSGACLPQDAAEGALFRSGAQVDPAVFPAIVDKTD